MCVCPCLCFFAGTVTAQCNNDRISNSDLVTYGKTLGHESENRHKHSVSGKPNLVFGQVYSSSSMEGISSHSAVCLSLVILISTSIITFT